MEYPYVDPYYAYNRQQAGMDCKVVVLGNTGVGKTSLVQRYVEDKFSPTSTTSTTGAFFVTKKVQTENLKVRLQIWDTAGQERFRSMAPMYYRGANAALVVYDLTNEKSFSDVKGWLEELKKNCSSDLIIRIVGSKADLKRHRAVTEDRARQLLHTWFPPPRPPPLPTPQTQASEQQAYFFVRPRLMSFPVARPALESISNNLGSSSSTAVLRRANSQREPAFSYSHSTTALPTGVKSSSDLPATGRPSKFPSRYGQRTAAHNGGYRALMEDEIPDSSEDLNNEYYNREWGLEPGMDLVEVSAKDDHGVHDLFRELIGAIILKRDVIEKERAERGRDSVLLTNMAPSWNAVADEQEREREKERTQRSSAWGGACC